MPPSTASQASYGALPPSLSITKAGLPLCSFASSGGYAQLSVLSWASNPYANSNAVAAPLLRFGSMNKQTAASSYGSTSSTGAKRNLLVLPTPRTPAYYITLQFSVKKNFNFTAARLGQGRSNYTIPDCTLNAGRKYIPCGSCNVSSFTDFNVTFGCYNSYDICPNGRTAGTSAAASSHLRVLLSQDEYLDDETNEEIAVGGGVGVVEGEGGGGIDVDMMLHRVLPGATTGAPIPAPVVIRAADDDGGFDSESDVLTYGTLVKSLAAEATKVLTANTPELLAQAIATGQATVVLSFVCSLTGVILLSLVFLARMDAWEKLEKKYMKKEREKVAMRLLAEDLRSGGKGDLGDMFVERYQRLAGTGKKQHKKVAGDALSEGRSSSWVFFNGNSSIPVSQPPPPQPQQHVHFSGNEYSASQTVDLGDNHTQQQLHFYGEDGHLLPTVVAKDIQTDSHDAYSHIAVATCFAVNKFPGDLIHVASKRGVLLQTIFDEHEYTSIFTDAPLAATRTDRFLELATDILITLFVSTLFFSVFYPSDQTCPSNVTKSTCLAAPSKVQAGSSLCQWDKSSRLCSLNPPPTDTTFTIIVALLCSIICLPFKAITWYLREEVTRKDPWNNGVDDEVVKIQERKELMRKMKQEKEEHEAAVRNADAETGGIRNLFSWPSPGNGFPWKSPAQRLQELNEKEQKLQVDLGAAQFGVQCRKEDNRSELGRLIKSRTKADTRELGRLNGANNSAAMWIYDELVSPAEEAAMLMADGTRCLQLAHMNDADDELGLHPHLDTVTTESSDGPHAKTVNRHVQICAIEEFLGLYPDGTSVPLTFRQRLMFGDSRAKLEYKVLHCPLHPAILLFLRNSSLVSVI